MKTVVVVDCQNDFISGPLACVNAENAVNEIIKYINENEVFVVYSLDWHSPQNKSFKINGGIWPVHCVQNSEGAKIHEKFFTKIKNEKNRPNETNMFYKGLDDEVEMYSAAKAQNKAGLLLEDVVTSELIIAGLASEYCVRETALELKEQKLIKIRPNMVGYVNLEDHQKTLDELSLRELVEI